MKNIYYLLREEYYGQRKKAIVLGAVIFCIFFLSRFVQEISIKFGAPGGYSYQDSIGGYLYLAGFIFTSISFARSMHSRQGQHNWLMMPVFAHEKLISKIIAYSVVYPAGLILFTFLSSALTEGFMALIWHHTVSLFNPFGKKVLIMGAHYFVLSSLFLMGASYFRTAHFIKTILSILAFAVSLGLILGLEARFAYRAYYPSMLAGNFHVDEQDILIQFSQYPGLRQWAEGVGKTLYWVIQPFFFWSVTYFRIREAEAKNAV
jgi:hypothetical protein